MSEQVRNRGVLLLGLILLVAHRTTVISGQQEEKFFYHADFTGDHQVAESQPEPQHQQKVPVFPDGPVHVSLGLRALSGDNRPLASSHAQVYLELAFKPRSQLGIATSTAQQWGSISCNVNIFTT